MSEEANSFAVTPALSLRQPWAWLVRMGFKDVENRNWKTNYRGKFFVHAAKEMTREEYDACQRICRACPTGFEIELPVAETLVRGAIIAEAQIVDCVMEHHSKWFTGKFGFVLRNVHRVEVRPCRGALGFFNPDTGRRIA